MVCMRNDSLKGTLKHRIPIRRSSSEWELLAVLQGLQGLMDPS